MVSCHTGDFSATCQVTFDPRIMQRITQTSYSAVNQITLRCCSTHPPYGNLPTPPKGTPVSFTDSPKRASCIMNDSILACPAGGLATQPQFLHKKGKGKRGDRGRGRGRKEERQQMEEKNKKGQEKQKSGAQASSNSSLLGKSSSLNQSVPMNSSLRLSQ